MDICLQLFTEVEVNIGEYLSSCEVARYKTSTALY